jgi:hypothetical protein
MDAYDRDERPRLNIVTLILNVLTVLVLLAALCWGIIFLNLFLNPQSGLNPFPPPTLPPTVPPATATPEAAQRLPPTHTAAPATETPMPTITATDAPSPTPSVTPTQFVLVSLTPVPVTEALDTSNVSFRLREGSPLALQNFAHPELGCDFLGVAGQVFEMDGDVVTQGITIQLTGLLGGSLVDLLSLTGATNLYGPGSYEFILADRPIASSNTLFIQLLDQAGLPLSDRIPFDTFADCDRNLILINFQQFR